MSFLFSIVLVPKAVRQEVFKRKAAKTRLQSLFATYAFFQPCDGYEQGTLDFLMAERTRQGTKDRGEIESVVQASQFGATVIVDDPWGRKLAAQYDLEFHGTLWVLQRLNELDLLATSLRDCFASLRLRRIRLPWREVNALLSRVGQQPL